MKFDLVSLLGIAAVLVMLVNLYFTLSMRAQIRGGVIGKRWNAMTLLVGLFAAGYFILPFTHEMPAETLRLLVSVIFFFGAVYVLISLRLIHGVVRELMS